jgi:hypothetical protein
MASFWIKFVDGIKGIYSRLGSSSSMHPLPDKEANPVPTPTPEEAHKSFREALTDYVATGWTIEIENQFDAVISKRPKFRWFLKLIIFLVLLFIFFPLAIFFLLVVLVRGLTAKPRRLRIYIDPEGKILVN